MLLDLVDANREQLSLPDTPEREALRKLDQKLMAALDALNGRMSKGTATPERRLAPQIST